VSPIEGLVTGLASGIILSGTTEYESRTFSAQHLIGINTLDPEADADAWNLHPLHAVACNLVRNDDMTMRQRECDKIVIGVL
jgi:hypothetical protein